MIRNPLSILNPAYHIVNFYGVPIYRAQAWALLDAELHGQRFTVTSGDRRPATIAEFNRKYGTHLHDQAYLYWGYEKGLPGFLPANPPTRGTHLLLGDGVVGSVGEHLAPYRLGIDVVSAGRSNDCAPLVAWLNTHGYHCYRPYPSSAEAHHMNFSYPPDRNARRRLAAYYRKRK